jgi:hypothetical protein
MSHVRRVLAVVAALALVLVGLVVTTVPASARPNCDVPDPPPICGVDPVEKLPDLTATVNGPASAVGGGVAAYTVRVANPTGTNAAAARGVAVRIATAGATLLTPALSGWTCAGSGASTTCSGGSLPVGGGATFAVSVQLPAVSGAVTVSATADPGNAIAERSETNNSGSLSTTVTAPALPDLQLTMTGPTAVRGVYANGVWTMTVTNRGSAPASPVNVRWLTNWGGTVNANAVKTGAIGFTCTVPPEYVQQLVYCYGTGALQPGASATIAITAVPPAPGNVYGTAGQSVVTGTVDYGQQVAESDENNNAASVTSTIQP